MPLARPCLDCKRPTRNGSRCPACEAKKQQHRNASRPHYQGTWRRTSAAAVRAHVARHGWVCPGWNRPPHESTDLTTDHVLNRDTSALVVLCRSCNSSKQ